MPKATPTHSTARRKLLHAALTPAALVLSAGSPAVGNALPAAAATTSLGDAELVKLAADLRTLEDAYNTAVGLDDDYDHSAHAKAEGDRREAMIGHMVAIPATGLAGIAAKAGRVCWSLEPRNGGGLMRCDEPLVASLAADLAWLVPQAVADAA